MIQFYRFAERLVRDRDQLEAAIQRATDIWCERDGSPLRLTAAQVSHHQTLVRDCEVSIEVRAELVVESLEKTTKALWEALHELSPTANLPLPDRPVSFESDERELMVQRELQVAAMPAFVAERAYNDPGKARAGHREDGS